MSRHRIITIGGLLLFCLVIILPPLIHGYVYPNVGDDAAVYLDRIEEMGKGQAAIQYTGYAIVGYPMTFAQKMFGWSIDTQFLWINFVALAFSGVVIYVVFSKLVNRLTGWLALLLVIFCAQGLLFLFYYGQIFNVINIGIIAPLLLLFAVRYLSHGRWYNLLPLLILVLLFSSFHTSGIYLPIIAGMGTFSYAVYCWFRKKRLDRRILYLGGGITAGAALFFGVMILMPSMVVMREFVESPLEATLSNVGKGLAVPLASWSMSILSPTLLVLIALGLVYFKNIRGLLSSRKVKMTMFLLIVTAALLMIVAFTKLSLDPWRQALDLATILAFVVAIYAGLLLSQRDKVVVVAVVLAIGFGLFHNLPTWFSYNSAMRDVDLQAIEYLDGVETFSCSSQVAPWIYVRYTDCQHQDNDGDMVVVRSQPMTPRSTEDNIWYQKHGWQPTLEYELVATFDDGEVEIQVYELTNWARARRAEMGN